MSAPIPARQQYNRRKSPEQYDRGFFDTELQNIQRAISRPTVRTITADSVITALDDLVLIDATNRNVTLTFLPAGRVEFLTVTAKRIDASGHTVTLGVTVDATANPTLAQWKSITAQSDGTSWFKLAGV